MKVAPPNAPVRRDDASRLGSYAKEVASLRAILSAPEPEEDSVWQAYAGTEKLIAILKFRLDYETPGVSAKLPEPDDLQKLVDTARVLLSKSEEELASGSYVDSIGTLRQARNNLRSYLTAKSLAATRKPRSTPS
jgi:hypothetical protein